MLSLQLMKDVVSALEACNEFRSNAELQAVFGTCAPLQPYRTQLPEADNIRSRVEKTLSYLLLWSPDFPGSACYAFIGILRDRQYDSKREQLETLQKRIFEELNAPTAVPFVIAAMTDTQAKELLEIKLKEDPSTSDLHRLLHMQATSDPNSLIDLYGCTAEHWRPCPMHQYSVSSLIYHVFDLWNQRHADPEIGKPSLSPHFLSNLCFSDNHDLRRLAWESFRRSGGVLITDTLSLFHPLIHDRLLRGEISTNEKVAMLVVSTLEAETRETRGVIDQLIATQLDEAFYRYDTRLDHFFDCGVSDLRAIRRWLYGILGHAEEIIRVPRPNPRRRDDVRRLHSPQGFAKIISGMA